jgi:hypothetical protein
MRMAVLAAVQHFHITEFYALELSLLIHVQKWIFYVTTTQNFGLVFMYIHTYMYIYIHTHVFIHVYIYIYIHTHSIVAFKESVS